MAALRFALANLPLLLLLLLAAGDFVNAIQHKCSACKAVALELERVLANEKPRNDLDLRHRLDSKGQREGRVIQYRYSELRVLELLEDLCSRVKDYTLSKSGDWIKAADDGRNEQEKQEREAHSKDIASYCGRLLGKHEDELARAIRKGDLEGDTKLGTVLCESLSKECNNQEREL